MIFLLDVKNQIDSINNLAALNFAQQKQQQWKIRE